MASVQKLIRAEIGHMGGFTKINRENKTNLESARNFSNTLIGAFLRGEIFSNFGIFFKIRLIKSSRNLFFACPNALICR